MGFKQIMMKKGLIFLLMGSMFLSCGNTEEESKNDSPPVVSMLDDKYEDLNEQARLLFGTLPTVAKNTENPITDEKVKLGKALYFDKRLSKDNTQSCNTCHNVNTFGVDNNPFSEGNDGKLGGRNSPTTFNAALHVAQFWDGREPDVEAQAGGPILNPVEMAMPSEAAVIERLSGIKEYIKMFGQAFPDAEAPINYDNLKKAIGAFERKLITPSKFDDYLAGDNDALTDKEKDGLQAYIDAGCLACHSGNLLGGKMYQKFGVYGDYWEMTKSKNIDMGKFDVTKKESDKYMFKVPSLRNIEKTAPYFHDGSVQDLNEAIRIMAKIQTNKDLTDEKISQIVDFLKTLTADIPDELKEN